MSEVPLYRNPDCQLEDIKSTQVSRRQGLRAGLRAQGLGFRVSG